MLGPRISIQSERVDEGNFNFPISSLPKGGGIGKSNFSLFLSEFDLGLEDVWKRALFENLLYCRFGAWCSEEAGSNFIYWFKKLVERELQNFGFNCWMPELYSIFCRFVRKKKLEGLKEGDMTCSSRFIPMQVFREDVLPKIWGRALEFQKSLTLAKIDNIDDLVSKKFLDSFPIVAKPVEPKDLIPVAEPSQIPSSENLFVREETVFPTLPVKLEEKVEKIVVYQNQVASLYFFYEYEIPKMYLRVFLHLEDLLYDIYEFNISKFLSFGEKGVM